MRLLSERRVLALLLGLAVLTLIASLFLNGYSTGDPVLQWLEGVLVNLGSGIVGTCIAFYLIDLGLNRRRDEERELARELSERLRDEQAASRQRASWMAQLRSQDLNEARVAIEELRLSGGLSSGVLSGADLSAADLRGLDLTDAELTGCTFRAADLRGTNLSGATLRDCSFVMADMRGCTTDFADVVGADFSRARGRGEV